MGDTHTLIFTPIAAEQTLQLRHDVLWPDLPIADVKLLEDDSGWHFGAFQGKEGTPIAVISLFLDALPIDSAKDNSCLGVSSTVAVRFRKFACHPNHQGRGIGTNLLKYATAFAHSDLGANVLWCDARTSTSEWYQRRGLMPFGPKFFKGPVEYVHMKMDLHSTRDL